MWYYASEKTFVEKQNIDKSTLLFKKRKRDGEFSCGQWSGLCTLTTKDTGSTPGWGTKIPQATQCGQKKKKRERNVSLVNLGGS